MLFVGRPTESSTRRSSRYRDFTGDIIGDSQSYVALGDLTTHSDVPRPCFFHISFSFRLKSPPSTAVEGMTEIDLRLIGQRIDTERLSFFIALAQRINRSSQYSSDLDNRCAISK